MITSQFLSYLNSLWYLELFEVISFAFCKTRFSLFTLYSLDCSSKDFIIGFYATVHLFQCREHQISSLVSYAFDSFHSIPWDGHDGALVAA